jgi:hypothetical protein
MKQLNRESQRALEQMGVFAQYFADRCVYLGQFPDGEKGRISISRGLRLQALILGSVIDLLRATLRDSPSMQSVPSIRNTHTGLKAKIEGVDSRKLRGLGSQVLKDLANEWHVESGVLTIEISGAALHRLQLAFDREAG